MSAGDIEEAVEKGRELTAEAADVCLVIAALNNLHDGDVFIQCLDSPHLDIPELSSAQFQVSLPFFNDFSQITPSQRSFGRSSRLIAVLYGLNRRL